MVQVQEQQHDIMSYFSPEAQARISRFEWDSEEEGITEIVDAEAGIREQRFEQWDRCAAFKGQFGRGAVKRLAAQMDCNVDTIGRYIAAARIPSSLRVRDLPTTVYYAASRDAEAMQALADVVLGDGDTEREANAADFWNRLEQIRNKEDVIALDAWKSLSPDEQAEALVPPADSGKMFNTQEGASVGWAHYSWNSITGCLHGCEYCYARDIANRFPQSYPHGFQPAIIPARLAAPANTRIPESSDIAARNVFTVSMGDLFGQWIPAEWVEAVLKAVREHSQWNFLMLTKHPQRLPQFAFPDNVWLGTTVDTQARVAMAERSFEHVEAAVKTV